MVRASGRLRFSADTTSSPLPSPSRRSTTAKAGAALLICASPSDTVSQDVTAKPRVSIARDRRSRNGLSSSTISSERSARSFSSAMAFKVGFPRGCGCRASYRAYGAAVLHCQGLTARFRLIRGPGSSFLGLEASTRPGDLHHGAVIGKGPVGERNLGAGAFQQRAGDEHAKTEAGAFAVGLIGAAAP